MDQVLSLVRRNATACLLLVGLCVTRCGFGQETSTPSNSANRSSPIGSEQNKLIETVTNYVDGYIDKLPNFICEQVTEQYMAGKKPEHLRKGDTLTSKLVFSAGTEQRTLQLVNNKSVHPGMRPPRTPLSTQGEFGILLNRIFDPASQATFTWNGWSEVRGHPVAVFDYAIDKQHSTLSLATFIRAVVPYNGSVFFDEHSGAVWRVTSGSTDIPEGLQTKSIHTVVDYDPVLINGKSYVMPLTASVIWSSLKDNVRNDLLFRDYRKFETESTITFGGEGNTGGQEPQTATPPPPQ